MAVPTLTTGTNTEAPSAYSVVPYYPGNNNGIPNIGATETGNAALSNAALVMAAEAVPVPQPGTYSGPGANKEFLGQPLGWFVGIAIIVLLLSWLNQSSWVKGSPAPIRPSLPNMLLIGLMSILFIVGSKALLTRYPVQGLSTLISGV